MATGTNEPFVTRFEQAIMQFVILEKAKQGEVTKDNLNSVFRGNLQMSKNHLDSCLQTLVQDGHLKEAGGSKYTITDDGREDVQKVQQFIPEIQQYASGGSQMGGSQQQRSTQQATTSAGGRSGSSTGTTSGGNVNQPTQQRGASGGNVGTGPTQGGQNTNAQNQGTTNQNRNKPQNKGY